MGYDSWGDGRLTLSRPLVWSEYGGSKFGLYSSITETEKYVRGRLSEMLVRVARHDEGMGELQDDIEVKYRHVILVGFLGEDQMADRSEPDRWPDGSTV